MIKATVITKKEFEAQHLNMRVEWVFRYYYTVWGDTEDGTAETCYVTRCLDEKEEVLDDCSFYYKHYKKQDFAATDCRLDDIRITKIDMITGETKEYAQDADWLREDLKKWNDKNK